MSRPEDEDERNLWRVFWVLLRLLFGWSCLGHGQLLIERPQGWLLLGELSELKIWVNILDVRTLEENFILDCESARSLFPNGIVEVGIRIGSLMFSFF